MQGRRIQSQKASPWDQRKISEYLVEDPLTNPPSKKRPRPEASSTTNPDTAFEEEDLLQGRPKRNQLKDPILIATQKISHWCLATH